MAGEPSFEDDTYYQIGAMKLENQPEGWATNYGSYYKQTTEGGIIGYQPVTYSEWQPNQYYTAPSYTKADVDDEKWKAQYHTYYTASEKDLSEDTWYEDEGVVFTRVPIPTFEVDKYYKLNDIASNLSGYEFYISNIKDKDGNSLPDRHGKTNRQHAKLQRHTSYLRPNRPRHSFYGHGQYHRWDKNT